MNDPFADLLDFSGGGGGIKIPGDPARNISVRQNNPFNLKHVGQEGSLGAGSKGFAIFPDVDTGVQAGINQLRLDQSRPLTLGQFAEKYAPAYGNPTWAADVSKALGVSLNTPLGNIPLEKLARVVARRESSTDLPAGLFEQMEVRSAKTDPFADLIPGGVKPADPFSDLVVPASDSPSPVYQEALTQIQAMPDGPQKNTLLDEMNAWQQRHQGRTTPESEQELGALVGMAGGSKVSRQPGEPQLDATSETLRQFTEQPAGVMTKPLTEGRGVATGVSEKGRTDRARITELSTQLEQGKQGLTDLKKQIDSSSAWLNQNKAAAGKSPQSVSEYNSKVRIHNELVKQARNQAKGHNEAVNEFNSLIKNKAYQSGEYTIPGDKAVPDPNVLWAKAQAKSTMAIVPPKPELYKRASDGEMVSFNKLHPLEQEEINRASGIGPSEFIKGFGEGSTLGAYGGEKAAKGMETWRQAGRYAGILLPFIPALGTAQAITKAVAPLAAAGMGGRVATTGIAGLMIGAGAEGISQSKQGTQLTVDNLVKIGGAGANSALDLMLLHYGGELVGPWVSQKLDLGRTALGKAGQEIHDAYYRNVPEFIAKRGAKSGLPEVLPQYGSDEAIEEWLRGLPGNERAKLIRTNQSVARVAREVERRGHETGASPEPSPSPDPFADLVPSEAAVSPQAAPTPAEAPTPRVPPERGVGVGKEAVGEGVKEEVVLSTDNFSKFMDKIGYRFASEAKGQAILDDLEVGNINPQNVHQEFWDNTYQKLTPQQRRYFERYVEKLSGFKKGDVIGTMKDRSDWVAKSWADLVELPPEVTQVEGTERGLVAMEAYANSLFRGQELRALPTSQVETGKGGEAVLGSEFGMRGLAAKRYTVDGHIMGDTPQEAITNYQKAQADLTERKAIAQKQEELLPKFKSGNYTEADIKTATTYGKTSVTTSEAEGWLRDLGVKSTEARKLIRSTPHVSESARGTFYYDLGNLVEKARRKGFLSEIAPIEGAPLSKAKREKELAAATQVPAPAKGREAWEMTREDYIASQPDMLASVAANKHWNQVRKALERGDVVPSEVISDYPDLRSRYGDKLESTAKEAGTEKKVASNVQQIKRLRNLAEGLQNQIDAKFNPAVAQQRPTMRRANMAASAYAEGERLQKIQTILKTLADRHESGEVPEYLSKINTKAAIEDLLWTRFPKPGINRVHLVNLLEQTKNKAQGITEERRHLSRMIGRDDSWVSFNVSDLSALKRVSARSDNYAAKQVKEQIGKAKRLSNAGIETPEKWQAARDAIDDILIKKPTTVPKEVKLKRQEQELIGLKIPGFFPTPRETAAKMVDMADIKPGMDVLEPSAGSGNIADEIKEKAPEAKQEVIEYNSKLAGILETKGYKVVGQDFLDSKKKYDRIVMNPPFENGQDIDHVRHAYDNLKPGGRLVSIISEGPFFRGDKKATAFRDWLDEVGGSSEKLVEKTFAKEVRATGVNGRIVIIDKPIEELPPAVLQARDALAKEKGVAPEDLTYIGDMLGENDKPILHQFNIKLPEGGETTVSARVAAAKFKPVSAEKKGESKPLYKEGEQGKIGLPIDESTITRLEEKQPPGYSGQETLPPKGQKKYAIEALGEAAKGPFAKNGGPSHILLDIPGDGEFRIFNTPEAIAAAQKQFAKFPVTPAKPKEGPTYPVGKPTGKRPNVEEGVEYFGPYTPKDEGNLIVPDMKQGYADGFYTQGHVLIKMPKPKGGDFKVPPEKIREYKNKYEKSKGKLAEIVGEYKDISRPDTKWNEVGIASGDTLAIVRAEYLDAIMSRHPKAKPYIIDENSPVIFRAEKDFVGLIMPMNGPHPRFKELMQEVNKAGEPPPNKTTGDKKPFLDESGQVNLNLLTPGLDIVLNFKEGVQSLLAPGSKSPEHYEAAVVAGHKLGTLHREAKQAAVAMKPFRRLFDKHGVNNPSLSLEVNPGVQAMSNASQGRPQFNAAYQKAFDEVDKGFKHRLDRLEKADAPLEQVRDNYFPGMWEEKSRKAFNQAMDEAIWTQNKGLDPAGDPLPPDMWTDADKSWVKKRVDELLAEGKGSDKSALQYLTKRPLKGRESFRKGKVFDDILTGVEFGLRPISNNPIDLVLLKYAEMDRSIWANELIQEFKQMGKMKFFHVTRRPDPGWKLINDKYSTVHGPYDPATGAFPLYGHWYATEPVAEIINNYLASSLYNTPYFGKSFRALMSMGNTLNQFQLMSAFHAGFTTAETQITAGAEVFKDIYGVARGNRTLGDLGTTLKKYPQQAIRTPRRGHRVMKEWASPTMEVPIDTSVNQLAGMQATATPADKAALAAKAAELAGGEFGMERGLRTQQTDKMIKNWYGGEKLKAVLRSPIALTEMAMRPIMMFLVPRQKAGVFAELAIRIMEQNPGSTLRELRPQLRQAFHRVDARLGQVVYDRLFMRDTAKNVLQMLIRAPGWTGGTITEVAGAPKDLGKFFKEWYETGRAPDDIPDRVAYVLSLLLTVGAVNALLTLAFTGERPHGMDFVAFRDGGKDKYSEPTRFLLPTYMKDLFAWWKAPGHTAVSKMHPIWNIMAEIWRNQDYYNTMIRNPEDPWPQQVLSFGKYTLRQFLPFGVRGMQKVAESESPWENPGRFMAPQVGIMPTTRAYTQTDAMGLMDEYFRKQGHPVQTPQEAEARKKIREVQQLGEKGRAIDFEQGVEGLKIEGKISKRQAENLRQKVENPKRYIFTQVKDIGAAVKIYDAGTEEEKQIFAPVLLKKINRLEKTDPDKYQQYWALEMELSRYDFLEGVTPRGR